MVCFFFFFFLLLVCLCSSFRAKLNRIAMDMEITKGITLLKNKDIERYRELIKRLGLRR